MAQRCLPVTRLTALPQPAPHWLQPRGVREASKCARLPGVPRGSTATSSLYLSSFVKAAAGASLPPSSVEVAPQSRWDLTLAKEHLCPFSTVKQQRLPHAHSQCICQLQDWELDL